MNQPIIPGSTARDRRLDVFRGLALLTIFINHVPGNPLEHFTSRNFGFSDAAEGFVLMSGIAVAYAYSGSFRPGNSWNAATRMLRRARTLYLVHLLAMAVGLVIVGAGLYLFGVTTIAEHVNFTRVQENPYVALLLGFPLLGYQIGYFNILPLYVVLLIAGIGFVWIGKRSLAAMLAVSVAIWLTAHITGLNFPNFPGKYGWFLNPIGWQLIFVAGIAGGLCAKRGEKLVPFNRWLYAAALAFVVWAAVWVKGGMGAVPGLAMLPDVFSDTDKGALAFLRLVHVLALAYVVTNTGWITRMAELRLFRPVELIGQNGLAVFAFGSIMAIFLQVFFEIVPASTAMKVVILIAGLLLHYAVAVYFAARKPAKRPAAAPATAQAARKEAPLRSAVPVVSG